MTLIEWRKDKELVKEAAKIIESPVFQRMLKVLQDENPVFYPLPKAGVTDSDRSHQLGQIEGACYVISALKSMGELLVEKRGFLKQSYKEPPHHD